MWMLFLSYSNFLVSPTSSLSARKLMRYHPHPYLHYNYPYIPVYIYISHYIYCTYHIYIYVYIIKYVNITSQFRLVIPIISHGSSWLVTHLPQTHLCPNINQYMCVYIYVYIISYHNILYHIILYYIIPSTSGWFPTPTSSRCQFYPHLRLRRGMSPFRRLQPLLAAQPLGAGGALRCRPGGAGGNANIGGGNAKLQ